MLAKRTNKSESRCIEIFYTTEPAYKINKIVYVHMLYHHCRLQCCIIIAELANKSEAISLNGGCIDTLSGKSIISCQKENQHTTKKLFEVNSNYT